MYFIKVEGVFGIKRLFGPFESFEAAEAKLKEKGWVTNRPLAGIWIPQNPGLFGSFKAYPVSLDHVVGSADSLFDQDRLSRIVS